MSVRISNNVIVMTRSDTLRTKITITDSNGDEYIPEDGDIIKFGVKKTIEDEKCLIEKEIPIDTMELHLEPNDTKNLDYGDYLYDVQIQLTNGDVYTFITYTKFRLTGEVV